jgi:hypothetical protein
MLQLFYPLEKTPGTHWIRGRKSLGTSLAVVLKMRHFFYLSEFEHDSSVLLQGTSYHTD